jgi:signal transduction histidine kinase
MAAKHAPAAPIRLTLDYGQEQTVLTIVNSTPATSLVEDAGVNGGFGPAGMRERFLLIGGTLCAGPAEGGWTVQAKVPQ